jgi:hypothetical protein
VLGLEMTKKGHHTKRPNSTVSLRSEGWAAILHSLVVTAKRGFAGAGPKRVVPGQNQKSSPEYI